MQLFPRWGSSRILTRRRHLLQMRMADVARERFESAWEGADSDRFRGENWLTSKLSSNDELTAELETLVTRSLDLYRKDVFAASAINGRVDNVVCTGIRPQSRIQPLAGVVTDEQAKEFNSQLEKAWGHWAKAERFYQKQRMLERSNAIYGEALAVFSDDDNPEKPVTLALQVLNPQRLPYETQSHESRKFRLGIRTDSRNRPIEYLIRRAHPYDAEDPDYAFDPIDSERVAHCFEEMFPGQLRGVPWIAPAMTRLKDLKDFAEAHLVAEQTAACHAAFVKGITDPTMLAEAGRARSDLQDINPGTIQYLNDGEDIEFSNPNRPGATLAPYMKWALQGVSAALRYPYELLIKEFTNNFSGGRLALIDGRMTFKTWQQMLIDSVFCPLWVKFVDQCVFQGVIAIDILLYEQNRQHFLQHAWIPPGWPWVDPEKEVKADVDAIAAGLLTETESLSMRGRDFEETVITREREQIVKYRSEARLKAEREKLGLSPVNNQPDNQGRQEPADATADNAA